MNIKTFVLGIVETNCYVVSDESKNCAIIDCDGIGKEVMEYIDENGLNPTHILLTHGHYDHTGAAKKLKLKYEESVICIGVKDEELLEKSDKSISETLGGNKGIIPDILLKEGDEIKVGNMNFKVLETPGHTKGSICFLVEDMLISGDTLFAGDCGRVDLYGGDWEQMKSSLKRLGNLEGDYKVLPGHGPSSTLAMERIHNQYMREQLL